MGGRRGGERAGVGQAALRRGRGGTAHGAGAGARGRDTAAAGAGSGGDVTRVSHAKIHGKRVFAWVLTGHVLQGIKDTPRTTFFTL